MSKWKIPAGRIVKPGPTCCYIVFSNQQTKLYAREKIPHKTRQLVTVGALTAMGMKRELRNHIWAAYNVGCTKEEIAEVIFQMHTYAGVPRMHNGLTVLRDVIQKRKEVFGDKEVSE